MHSRFGVGVVFEARILLRGAAGSPCISSCATLQAACALVKLAALPLGLVQT
jgi:hypothetical protein